MRREDLTELHFITSIANVPSILQHGILSHRRAASLAHETIAMPEIQDRRRRKTVPGGRPLHEYANLYVNGRNKMMYKVKMSRGDTGLAILRVDVMVLNLPGVVLATENASSDYVRFARSPAGLGLIDTATVLASSWTHPNDQVAEWRHGSAICAEVLVPDRVQPDHIQGAYVSCSQARSALEAVAPGIEIHVNARLFFR